MPIERGKAWVMLGHFLSLGLKLLKIVLPMRLESWKEGLSSKRLAELRVVLEVSLKKDPLSLGPVSTRQTLDSR